MTTGRDDEYAAYLATPEWQRRVADTMRRQHGVCAICRKRKIDDVHHVTYANVGHESPADLVGTCRDCHRRAPNHGEWAASEDRAV